MIYIPLTHLLANSYLSSSPFARFEMPLSYCNLGEGGDGAAYRSKGTAHSGRVSLDMRRCGITCASVLTEVWLGPSAEGGGCAGRAEEGAGHAGCVPAEPHLPGGRRRHAGRHRHLCQPVPRLHQGVKQDRLCRSVCQMSVLLRCCVASHDASLIESVACIGCLTRVDESSPCQ